MAEIVLVNIPPWGVVMPPLGIAYLAAYLKAKGIGAAVCDLNVRLYNRADAGQKKFWRLDTINTMEPATIAAELFQSFEPVIRQTIDELAGYPLIGCSANNLISAVFTGILARGIKERNGAARIVVGGPGCFHGWDRKAMSLSAVDYVVIGEGEEALFRLVQALPQRQGALTIPGVWEVSRARQEQFIPPAAIANLDSVPFPTFEEFSMPEYGDGKPYRPLPMLMSRGCINQCSYCIDCRMNFPFRSRSAAEIIAEMKHHVRRYGITHVEFNDLLCNGNLRQLENVCDGLIAERLNVRWISYAAIRRNMTEALFEKMKQAGCGSLCYGLESGSDAVLRRMNKHYTRDDAAAVLRRTYAAGIEVRCNIIVGFPGETDADFRQTLDFVRENRQYISQVTNVSSFVFMPAADIGVYPHRYGVTFTDPLDPGTWTDENRLTPQERSRRVQEVCRRLREWNIPTLIVNDQEENRNEPCPTGRNSEPVTVSAGGGDVPEPPCSDIPVKKFRRSGGLPKFFIVMGLALVSGFIDIYLWMLKKIRGSIIFPGS